MVSRLLPYRLSKSFSNLAGVYRRIITMAHKKSKTRDSLSIWWVLFSILPFLAIGGNPEAFGAIITRYQASVFGVALARLRHFHDAQDIAQNAFVEAFESLERLIDPDRLGTWLSTITIHRCIDHITMNLWLQSFAYRISLSVEIFSQHL